MDITKQDISGGVELFLKGRLDAYWSDHLTKSLTEVIRKGTDHVRLNLSEVLYLSSAGIRVLLQAHKQLKGIQGKLDISNPSDHVTTVLRMAGLDVLLLSPPSSEEEVSSAPLCRQLEMGQVKLEIYDETPKAALSCQIVGDPNQLFDHHFTEADSHTLSFPPSTLAIGLGAIGEHFQQCRGRFGEFLAAAGAAGYLPTDGTNVPDYSMARGRLVPTLQILYALKCEGNFSHLIRFEPAKETHAVRLSELVDYSMNILGTNLAGFVMVAESAGLLGAALKQSPTQRNSNEDLFHHPEIRKWLTFTPERIHTRGMTLVVGVAARTTIGSLTSFLRPLGPEAFPSGHFHAATFSYHPLKRGKLDCSTTVMNLFNEEQLQGILHLVNDHRAISGRGENEFFRGACWVGPIQDIIGADG
ncbi:MAG: STAS domain-containing protein [Nitrospirales bacterium]